MEKKELRKKIEELDVKRKVKEIRGDTPDYDTDNRYHYVSEEDILELLDKAREEGRREGSEITSRYISDFVKSESGKSGRKEILEYIDKLSKLKQ